MIETILSAKCGEFTVDVTQVDVAASIPALAPARILKEPLGDYLFTAQDNALIKDISVALPYNFCLSDERLSVYLTAHKASDGAAFPLSELSDNGNVWIFSENLDVPLDVFFQWQNYPVFAAETNIYFQAQLASHIDPDGGAPLTWPRISMLSVPADLDTLVMPIYAFIRVIHTLPLSVPAP